MCPHAQQGAGSFNQEPAEPGSSGLYVHCHWSHQMPFCFFQGEGLCLLDRQQQCIVSRSCQALWESCHDISLDGRPTMHMCLCVSR